METMDWHEIIDGLRGVSGWNNFAQTLLAKYDREGELAWADYDAAERMLLRLKATADRRKAEMAKVDAERIEVMLMTAKMSGIQHPKFRAYGLTFSLAPATGRNAGAVYVKQADLYCGKIADGTFQPSREAPQGTGTLVGKIAADPRACAVAYGKQTGRCSCCGRHLTDAKSVELGIGPICADRWGL